MTCSGARSAGAVATAGVAAGAAAGCKPHTVRRNGGPYIGGRASSLPHLVCKRQINGRLYRRPFICRLQVNCIFVQ